MKKTIAFVMYTGIIGQGLQGCRVIPEQQALDILVVEVPDHEWQ